MTEERRKAKTAYDMEYMRTHYKRITLQVVPEEAERWRAAADAAGLSLQRFVRQCVNGYIGQAE